jgi:hypothetical protein
MLTAFYLGDYTRATTLLEESLAVCRGLGKFYVTIFALTWLGHVALCQGASERATKCFEEGLALAREWNSKSGITFALRGLGRVVLGRGSTRRAKQFVRESLALYRGLDFRIDIANCFSELATVAISDQEPPVTAILLGAAAALRESIGTAPPVHTGGRVRTECGTRTCSTRSRRPCRSLGQGPRDDHGAGYCVCAGECGTAMTSNAARAAVVNRVPR